MTLESSRKQEREIQLDANELIVSKTDPTGKITYANRVFMRLAGYAEHELLGKPHNLIRHPDMPRGVFRLMWKTLQTGEEFFGVVKNSTSNGDYYWVLANITPDYDYRGTLQGYYSVRRRPSRAAIGMVSDIYAQMRRVEAASGKAEAPDASIAWLVNTLAGQGTDYNGLVATLLASQDTPQRSRT